MINKRISNRAIIWILGSLATVTPFAIDLYLPAFGQIAEQFHSTTASVSLSVSSYFIGMAIGQILYGPLLDRFGRKPPLYVGLTIFVLTSIACTQVSNVDSLIILRFLQALGGSVAWVAALAMVRDFFPVSESAKIFSLLILIIGVSPLLAPTVGGYIATLFGWQAIFFMLATLVIIILSTVFFFLPEGHEPDKTMDLGVKPMTLTFLSILKEPQFATYTFAGAFSFSTLFIYVAGSPIIFMDVYHVTPKAYGGIFALLSVGFIGGSQLNIFLNRRYSSDRIFKVMLIGQVIFSTIFLLGLTMGLLDLPGTIVMFFLCLSCIGFINPNASALAIAPFSRTVGSASALMAFTQLGISAIISFSIGLLNTTNPSAIVTLMVITSILALFILLIGIRTIGKGVIAAHTGGENVVH